MYHVQRHTSSKIFGTKPNLAERKIVSKVTQREKLFKKEKKIQYAFSIETYSEQGQINNISEKKIEKSKYNRKTGKEIYFNFINNESYKCVEKHPHSTRGVCILL